TLLCIRLFHTDCCLCFFFQAEDGIRDATVTGVQTCALPISYLAEYFDTIEINTSFYQPLRAKLCAQWLDRVAANPRFAFTAKLWQKFTHETGATVEDERAVRAGFDLLQRAGRLGAVLLQFPYSFHCVPENVAYLKELLER